MYNSTNTMAIGRPSSSQMSTMQCYSDCSELGPVDPLNKAQLGPRPNRELVRDQIRDYILNMMGAPALKLELNEQNIAFCVDQSLKIVEEYAPREFFSYHTFLTVPGKSVYELPPDIGIVRNVFYNEEGAGSSCNFAMDLGGALPLNYYDGTQSASMYSGMWMPNQPLWGNMGEWVLYKQYQNMHARLSSQLGGWEWVGGLRHIKLYPVPRGGSKVIVHYLQRNKDWGEVTQAMQEGALSYAKEIIGRVRSKYAAPPGPGGGMALDGQALIAEAQQERQQWQENLIYKFGDLPFISMD